MLEFIPNINKYIADSKIQAKKSTNYTLHPTACNIFQSITINHQIFPSFRSTQNSTNNSVTSKAIRIGVFENYIVTHYPNGIYCLNQCDFKQKCFAPLTTSPTVDIYCSFPCSKLPAYDYNSSNSKFDSIFHMLQHKDRKDDHNSYPTHITHTFQT